MKCTRKRYSCNIFNSEITMLLGLYSIKASSSTHTTIHTKLQLRQEVEQEEEKEKGEKAKAAFENIIGGRVL